MKLSTLLVVLSLATSAFANIAPLSLDSWSAQESLSSPEHTMLVSAPQSTPYEVTGSFTMYDDWDHFKVTIRTDLSSPGAPYYELRGVLFCFSNDGDQISIQRYIGPDNWGLLALASYALETGWTYAFRIWDDGYNVGLELNGANELTASTSYAPGSLVAMHGQWYVSQDAACQVDARTNSLAIDAVTAPSSVPDGGVFGALGLTLFLLGCARFAVDKRRFTPHDWAS